MKRLLIQLISIFFHLLAISLIIYLTRPVVTWYLGKIPARGIDLYLSASYVSHLLNNFAFRFNGWKEFWFSGLPYAVDYPSLYFYLMIPFTKLFGLIEGIQLFAVFGLFIFAVFSYLLFAELSKNRILAIILTIATVYSTNLYRALIWAGGIPFWTTQAFFPIVLFLVVKFCRSENRKWFYLAVLASGLGIMGHPQNFVNLILPSTFIILFLWRPSAKKFSPVKRFSDVFLFGFLTYLIGLPFLTSWLPLTNLLVLITFLKGFILMPFAREKGEGVGTKISPEGLDEIDKWTKSQFNVVFSDTHQILWILLGLTIALLIVSLVLRKRRMSGLFNVLAFTFLPVWTIGLVFLYSRGINVFVTGWYKAFWPVVASVATATAFYWGEAKDFLSERDLWQGKIGKISQLLGTVLVNMVLIGLGIYFLLPAQNNLLLRLEQEDISSSAFPEALNGKIKKDQWQALKKNLTPKLIVDNPRDFRLYTIDATVNIWWSTMMEMPLTRGYVDPPIKRGYIFWLDSALGPTSAGPKSSLIEDWHTPEEVADNNVRFLLDWSATRYLEGNHLSLTNSHFTSNITTDKFIEDEEETKVPGAVVNRFLENESWDENVMQGLNFFRIKKDLVTPILMETDASPVLFFGDEEGYDILTRILGEFNLGPRKIILAKGSQFIDQMSFSDLQNFQALILYRYDYKNHDKAWKMIEKYVEKGGKIYIDTGSDVKESSTTTLPADFPAQLPAIFPISKTTRGSLGIEWEPEVAEDKITEGVNFNEFSPLNFDRGPWNISHPLGEDDLRKNAKVILRQKQKIVLAEKNLGRGKVIWSGYNLPYHTLRDYNREEGLFFQNLLGSLVNFKESKWQGQSKWISPRERTIDISGGKGVLFKELAFDGWKASLNGKNLKIYKVGASDPGYMYVRLPENASGTVKFVFEGALASKIYEGVSIAVIFFILDYLLGGKVLSAIIRNVAGRFHLKAERWLSKEEEY